MKNERFSKENIESKVSNAKEGLWKWFLHKVFWLFFDFSSIYLTIIWVIAFHFLNFDSNLFTVVFLLLQIINIYVLYIILIKFYKFKINEFTVYSDKITKPIKLVFVSDIHTGKAYYSTRNLRLRMLVDKINKTDKDLLILGGDFLTEGFNPSQISELKNLQGNKIAVYGNHDSYYWKDHPDRFTEEISAGMPTQFLNEMKNIGIKVFINESEECNLNGQKILIGGIPDLYDQNFDLNKTYQGKNSNLFRLLMSHNPDIWEFIIPEDNIDLVLSGHLHSGQIHSTLTGPLLPMPSKHKHHTQGLYKIAEKTLLLISQGAGYSGTRFKLGVDNEIIVINLSPQSP